MSLRSPAIFFVVFLVTCCCGYSQNYIFNRLSIGDGLISNNIKAVWQDQTGYLWIGSSGGLQRYDGAVMRTVLPDRVDQILSDSDQRVWIRSGTRIGIFNTETFSVTFIPYEYAEETFNPMRLWLRKDSKGKIFVVLTGKNCQYLDEKKLAFSRNAAPFVLPDSLRTTDIIDDPARQRYWVLAQNGFGYWDKKAKSYYTASHNPVNDPLLADRATPPVVARLHVDRENRIWMVEAPHPQSRFLCFDSSKKQYTTDTLGFNSTGNILFEVYGFSTYHDSITIAYGHNYFRIRQGKICDDLKAPLHDPYGIQFNSIAGTFQDREGILWVATDNGLFYTSSTKHKYIHIVLSQEKQHGAISSFLQDNKQNLWIGTWGRGSFLMADGPNGPEVTPVRELNRAGGASQLVWSLCADDGQYVWIGCDQGLLTRYDPAKKKAEFYRPAAFANSAIRQIVKDPQGDLWIGLQNGNVFSFNPSEKFRDGALQQVFSLKGPVNRMVFANPNHLWIAINGYGVVAVDIVTKKIIGSTDIQKAGSVLIAGIRDILPVNDSICLVAGEKLGNLNPKTFRPDFNYLRGDQPAGTLFTIQKDGQKSIWIGSSEGISRFNPVTGALTRYSQEDGLITVHNNSYVPERSLALSDGRFVFGGNQHMVVFNPEEYRESALPPDVTITGLLLNDRYLPADSLSRLATITLPYSHSALGIDFAAINFSQRGKLSYEYKLEGQDTEWVTLTSSPGVRYHFLPHGQYSFLVRAKNEQGEYSPTVTSLNLRIRPPFWKTIWFYALVTLAIGSILFYLYRIRLQKLLHVEKVRNRLARDLHDDMGSTLSTINILSNMALQQESLDPGKNKQYLDTISKSTHQMMEAMDDIVWSINPVNDSMAKIIARMKETAGTVLEPAQIEYRFEVDPDVPDLHLAMEVRREIFLIFKEALNNIVKYAGCSMVIFKFSKKAPDLVLTISDNGTGFETSAAGSATRGNGLRNMQHRAANAGGKLVVTSQPGTGTSIGLSVPIA